MRQLQQTALLALTCLASCTFGNGRVAVRPAVANDAPPIQVLEGAPPRTGDPIAIDREQPSDTIFVTLESGAQPQALAWALGLTYVRPFEADPNRHFFKAATSAEAVAANAELQKAPGVIESHVMNKPRLVTNWAPNDPYFSPVFPPAQYPGQWHIYNKAKPMLDLNVSPVWDSGSLFAANYTGNGVIVCNPEEGVVISHLDLFANFKSTYAYDYVDGDNAPYPAKDANGIYYDPHGTACAGLLAAVGANGRGGTGVAPEADLSPIRFSFSVPADGTSAIVKNSTSPNTFINIKSQSYGYDLPFYENEDDFQALGYSTGAGTIHCLSAGNYRNTNAGDSGSMHSRAARRAIVVGALGSNGKFSNYSNFGSCLFCCAPSSSNGFFGIASTDNPGEGGYNLSGKVTDYPNRDYTNSFGGTSAATPEVAGVMALAKEAQPALSPRMAQHLLVKTCRKVDPNDNTTTSYGGWRANAAGIEFNPNYGFGLVDAAAFVDAAKQYTGVTAEAYETTGVVTNHADLPDNNSAGASWDVTMPTHEPLESIQIYPYLQSERYSDLEVWIRSPQGMWSPLVRSIAGGTRVFGSKLHVETLVTNAFWGQDPYGVWRVLIRDSSPNYTTYLENWQCIFYTGKLTGTPKTMTGTVNLGSDWEGGDYGTPARLSIYGAGDIFPTKTHQFTIKPDGKFSFPTTLAAGTYTMYLNVWHWLRAKKTVIVGATGANTSWTLLNGDIDNDNAITVFDYSLLSDAWDTDPTSMAWNPDADLNGNGTIEVFDYSILSTNFDKSGS